MTYDTHDIIFEERGHIGLITLNRPDVLNATTTDMNLAIHQHLDAWEAKDNIKAVVIRGEGDRAFCAGGDIRRLYDSGKEKSSYIDEFFPSEYRLNHCLFHFKKPYIALLDGITMGGGVGISVYGSHRIATERLEWAMPETRIGYFPDIGSSYFFPRCVSKTGFYLALSSAHINAIDACYVGVADYVISSNKQEDLITQLTEADFSNDVHTTAHVVVDQILESFKDASTLEALKETSLENHQACIDRCFSEQTIEKIFTALEKDNDKWGQQCLTELQKRSPTSLKVTLEQLQRGQDMTFDDCMRMEYRLNRRFIQNNDFYEGVRAAIVDKDRKPKWEPADLNKVSKEHVLRYFEPLKKGELSFS